MASLRNFLGGRAARRIGAVMMATGVMTSLVGAFAPASGEVGDVPVVTLEDGVNGCNGVRPTPGSENTTKRLDPNFASNFDPGGLVGFIIDYPVDATDVAGRTTFVITDCVFVDDNAVAKYSVSFVPNTEDFELRFAVPIAAGTPLGAQFCNYAKTTAAPSESQASNRKAGPACFTVGGGLRIEKRSGSTTGPLLAGAGFSVVCSPTVPLPPTIITGLSNQSQTNQDGTVSASGTATTGAIAVNGPSGTPCTVTETAAPDGYQLDATPRSLVIPIGTSQTVSVFVNVQLGDLVITKATNGGSGTFTFDVDCTGTTYDTAVTITDNGSRTITGIAVGTECTVTERAASGFSTVSSPADGQVTIASGTNTVAFTNTRLTGDLVVTKTTTGGSGTFSFAVDCDGTAFDQTLTVTDNGSRTVTGIPTGTSCTVTETADPLFTSTSVPADGTVTIATGSNTVAFANARKTGDLVVTKETTGGSGTFTFDVDCTGTGHDQSVTITDSGARRISSIPTGTTCTVTERDDSLFSGLSVPADGQVVIAVGDNTVAFTNTRDTGNLVVTKATVGGSGTFTFDVDCDGTVHDQSFTITDNGSKTITGIPTGTDCTVSEQASALFTSASVPADGKVTIGATAATVAFTNTARPAGITLDKKVNGGDHATSGDALVVHAGDRLTYTVRIENAGNVALTLESLADTLEPGFADLCPEHVGATLAAGSSFTCAYQRSASGDATNTASVGAVDALGRKSGAADSTFVKVITPAITITKAATPASVSPGQEVTFTYTVTNTGDTTLNDVTVTDDVLGGIAVIGTMAPGAVVAVTKSQVVEADSPTRNIGTAAGTDVLGRQVSANAAADIAIVLGVTLERPTLPRTGAPISLIALTGLFLVLFGTGLVVTGRRHDD
ncbi:MAG TPA: DUF5979 domain-containing protein [Acidimicrobiales bacterium]|nr:DUF5979 domain-containing protein [Acidimicrobiales bacterium]